jgi:PIN domain nuclease of toxin-antitoxin system
MGSATLIVLDTHVWVWWVQGDSRLTSAHVLSLQQNEARGLGVSAISLWEVAKLVEYGRLVLPVDVGIWLRQALAYPGVRLLRLTWRIAVESTRLPISFHKDPADQIIVATARVFNCPLMTYDNKIQAYPHVRLVP